MATRQKRTPLSLTAASVLLLLAGGLLLAGCESDATAPQDEVPTLTRNDVAQQAAFAAKAAAVVGPEVVKFSGLKDSYTRTFGPGGDINGTVRLDYFLGGAGGSPASWDTGDYAHLYTAPGTWLTVALGYQGTVILTFDITAVIDRPSDAATISGGGTYRSGAYFSTFTFSDMEVTAAGAYPSAGSLTFTAAGFLMVVEYDGDNTALATIDGVGYYMLNLDTGEVTELAVP